MNHKNILTALILTTILTQNAQGAFTQTQKTEIAQMIQQGIKQKSMIQELKDFAKQGAGYTVCTVGMLYGLNHFGSAYKYTLKTTTPITNHPEKEAQRYSKLAYSHATIGLLCCGASAYGLYHLWHN